MEERIAQLEKQVAELKVQAQVQPIKNELAFLECLRHRITKVVPDSEKRRVVLTALEERCCSVRSLLQQREELLRHGRTVLRIDSHQTV